MPASALSRDADLSDIDVARTLLDQLLIDSRLYRTGPQFRDLLDFIVRMRKFAPFNALMLQVQKPGLTWAASAREWREGFERRPLPGARPLIILWPMGPVAFVYDVLDTEGKDLPLAASPFAVQGFRADLLPCFKKLMHRKIIQTHWADLGDGYGGSIRRLKAPVSDRQAGLYELLLNQNHSPAAQFSSLAHELGHLFLGHMGADYALNVPRRRGLTQAEVEIEAESVAFLVCERNGVSVRSERYLSRYVTAANTIEDVNLYQVTRAAGQVEAFLGLTMKTIYDIPVGLRRRTSRGRKAQVELKRAG